MERTIAALGAALLLAACATQPSAPLQAPAHCDPPPAALLQSCTAPPAPASYDLGGLLENHVLWRCEFWRCADRLEKLAECVSGQARAPLPVPADCLAR